MVVQIQQVAEKMLKSVLELISTNTEHLLKSHNLRQIYDAIHQEIPEFNLNRQDLGFLKDFYFEAKDPGENFITVEREDCATCLHTMYTIINEVNTFRKSNGLEYHEITEKYLCNSRLNESYIIPKADATETFPDSFDSYEYLRDRIGEKVSLLPTASVNDCKTTEDCDKLLELVKTLLIYR